MSVEAFSWALTVPVGGNAKIMLLGLANHAHPDGTEAYPSLDTLARYGHCDRSTARRNVRKLVTDDWIEETGTGPFGQAKYRLKMERGGESPPVANSDTGGGKTPREGVAQLPPEPSKEPSTNRTKGEESNAPDPRASLPDDFPVELKPHARIVYRLLCEVAAQHNAREVRPLALGRVMMARPRKPFVKAAHDMAAWAADPPRPIRDVVATYRTWIERERNLQTIERVDDEPPPANGRRKYERTRSVEED